MLGSSLRGLFHSTLWKTNMEPDKGPFVDYCRPKRCSFQVPFFSFFWSVGYWGLVRLKAVMCTP